ncbi:hypothetical protein G6011_00858 [Alternaria panax]|uniref:Uncharacterized protein n=1 Tax=Alternaria panax TaxID=48097 RepID=A0AAD4IJJ2_9PLEO|nr:hypothetical protein G6011_00858 [Alternaria panax]
MALVLDFVQGNTLSPTFAGFFNRQTQEMLLKPLMTNLHGYKSVDINGHVDSALATTFTAKKDKYTRLFKEKNIQEACIGWQDTVYEMDNLLQSSSWPNLIRLGSDEFVSQIAPLYFLMQLNIAHIQIGNMQDFAFGSEILAEGALLSAVRSMKPGFWKSDYKYKPSVQHLAKLRYRYAMYMRLDENPEGADRALTYIDAAIRLQPGNVALMRERENIRAWIQQL